MQPGEHDEIQAIRAELRGLRAKIEASGQDGDVAGVDWNLTAVYVPFGANGGNPSLTSTQSVDGLRRGH